MAVGPEICQVGRFSEGEGWGGEGTGLSAKDEKGDEK